MVGTKSSGEFVATSNITKSNVTGTQHMILSKQVSDESGPPQDMTASLGHLLKQQQSSSTSGENAAASGKP